MRFITGDHNGLIKSLRLDLNGADMNGNGVSTSSLTQDAVDPSRSIQKMHYSRDTKQVGLVDAWYRSNTHQARYRQS